MADKNIPTTPVGETPENQKQLWQVENPTKVQETTVRTKAMNLILMLQLAVWSSWIAYAKEPPKDMSVNSPDAKELVLWEKEQITFNWSNYDTSDLKIIKQEWIKVEMDKVAETEMLDLYKTKKWWDKVIERYNSLLDRYKTRIVKYYKETKEQWLPLRAVSFKIKTFDNYQQWKIFLFDATKTWKVWDMTERIGTALEWMFEIDEKWSMQFTQGEFVDFSVTDNTVLLKMNSNIENLTKKSENLTKKSEDLTKKSEDLTKKSEDLTKKSEDLTKKSEDLEEKIRWSNEFYNRILEAKWKK